MLIHSLEKIIYIFLILFVSILLLVRVKECKFTILVLDDFNKNIETNACSDYNSKKHGYLVFNAIKTQIPKEICRKINIKLVDVVHNGNINEKLVSKELIKASNEKTDIINMSFGSIENNKYIDYGIKYISKRKTQTYLISSAGNNFGMESLYPARLKSVISIGSLTKQNEISNMSAQKSVNYYIKGVHQNEDSTSLATGKFTGFLSRQIINNQCHDLVECTKSNKIKLGDKKYEN